MLLGYNIDFDIAVKWNVARRTMKCSENKITVGLLNGISQYYQFYLDSYIMYIIVCIILKYNYQLINTILVPKLHINDSNNKIIWYKLINIHLMVTKR